MEAVSLLLVVQESVLDDSDPEDDLDPEDPEDPVLDECDDDLGLSTDFITISSNYAVSFN